MGKVVNLGRARKKRRRLVDVRRADANALAHGRTKAEKLAAAQERARLQAAIEGARLEPEVLAPSGGSGSESESESQSEASETRLVPGRPRPPGAAK